MPGLPLIQYRCNRMARPGHLREYAGRFLALFQQRPGFIGRGNQLKQREVQHESSENAAWGGRRIGRAECQ